MSCSCVYIHQEYDSEILKEKTVKAKRKYKCCECGETIQAGELHEYVFGVDDGPFHFRTCADCVAIKKLFFCYGWVYTMVLDDLLNHFYAVRGEVDSECLLALPESARWKVMDLLDKTFDTINRKENHAFI